MKNIFFIISVATTLLFAKFNHLDDKQVLQMVKKGVPIIDIRRPDEWKQYGIIKGAKLITFFDKNGRYNVKSWLKKFTKIVKDKNQPFIIYCAHANRSKVVGNFLDKQLGYKNVNELKGGIIYGWIDKGRKTVMVK